MVRRTLQLILAALLLLQADYCIGGSVFSANGLGEAQVAGGARVVGLGGGGLGLLDTLSVNTQNPALIAFMRSASFRTSMKLGVWSTEAQGKTDADSEFGWNGLHLFLPVSDRYKIGVGIEPMRRSELKTFTNREVVFTGSDSTETCEERVVWKGSTTDLKLDNAYRVNDRLAFGVTAAYRFINQSRDVILDFDVGQTSGESDFRDAVYYQTARFKGWWTKFSLFWQPTGRLGIGGYFQPRTGGNWELESSENDGSQPALRKRDGESPSTMGAGISFMARRNLVLTADVQTERWKRRDLGILFDGEAELEVSNPLWVSVGIEKLAKHDRLGGNMGQWGYRGGFFYRQHYWTADNGDAVGEIGLAVGMSIPVGGWSGRIHLAGEFGRRGNDAVGATEDFMRMTFQIEMSEKWFQRRKSRIPK